MSEKKGAAKGGGDKLKKWQEIVTADEDAYADQLSKMDERESIYQGKKSIDAIITGDGVTETPHVSNIVAEMIESQIDSSIPPPKVSSLRKDDEKLAKLIEDMIRNKLDKLPVELINDQMERCVKIQGGGFAHYEWDSSKATHTTQGEGSIAFRHPKQVIPQQGITSDIEDMDRVTLRVPQTAEAIKRKYGVEIASPTEEAPETRSATGETETVPDMVTQYIVYYRNEKGGIGKYSWACDTELEDYEDYQARHLRRCIKCGEPEPFYEVDALPPTRDGSFPSGEGSTWKPGKNGACPHCGGSFEETEEEFYEVRTPIELPEGTQVPAGTQIPYYKPDIFPIFLQQNISSFGRLLGESDVDKIKTHQNLINRLWAKICDQLLAAGSYLMLPAGARITKGTGEYKEIRYDSVADISGIKPLDMTVNIEPSLAAIENVYIAAQREMGITDSFLGRKDTTATSGKAKEFSAAQAAGRLESKRLMKSSMYQRLFEAIFKFELAYADEPRPVVGTDERGYHTNEEWNKWAFLSFDEAGAPYWKTDFLFSTDGSAPLAQNREAMWQEMRSHFESGAFGAVEEISTKLFYWEEMARLHYPGAENVRDKLRGEKERQDKMSLESAKAEKQALNMARQDAGGESMPPELPEPSLEGGAAAELLAMAPNIPGGEML